MIEDPDRFEEDLMLAGMRHRPLREGEGAGGAAAGVRGTRGGRSRRATGRRGPSGNRLRICGKPQEWKHESPSLHLRPQQGQSHQALLPEPALPVPVLCGDEGAAECGCREREIPLAAQEDGCRRASESEKLGLDVMAYRKAKQSQHKRRYCIGIQHEVQSGTVHLNIK